VQILNLIDYRLPPDPVSGFCDLPLEVGTWLRAVDAARSRSAAEKAKATRR
jgi:hypothetical protein